jgi:hypothetical protein
MPPAWTVWALAGVLVALGAATLALAARGRPLAACLVPAAGFAAVYLFVVAAVYPAFEPGKSARALAGRLAAVTAESRARGLPIVAYAAGNVPKALAFYTDGIYTVETEDPAVLARHLDRDERVFAVVNADRLAQAAPELLGRLTVVESTVLSRRTVLLASNR